MRGETSGQPGLTGDAVALTKRLGGQWNGQYGRAPCPVCQKGKQDTALELRQDGGRVRFTCFRCQGTETLYAALKPLGLGAATAPAIPKQAIPKQAIPKQAIPKQAIPKQATSRPAAKPDQRAAATLQAAIQIWNGGAGLATSGPDCPIIGYLAGRGLANLDPGWLDNLKATHRLKHTPTGWQPPALLARIQRWPDDRLIAIQRTWIEADHWQERIAIMGHEGGLDEQAAIRAATSDSPPAKLAEQPKMILGRAAGGAVRLGPPLSPERDLILTEGVEDGLAACLMTGGACSVWACTGTSALAGVLLPDADRCRQIIAIPDNDPAGNTAFEKLASRWPDHNLHRATPAHSDLNDMLRKGAGNG